MALLDIGNSSSNVKQNEVTTLPGMTPGQSVNRANYETVGAGQSNLFTAMLGEEYANAFGTPGQAAVPSPNQQAFNAGKFTSGIFGSPEAAAYLGGAPLQNVVQNAYANLLGRQGSAEEIQNWINTGQGGQGIVQGILNSAEFGNRAGTLTTEQGLQALYSGVLGREASGAELNNWYNAAGMPAAQDAVAATPPGALPHQELFDMADQMMKARLGGGEGSIVSPEMRAKIGESFAFQRSQGLEDLQRNATTMAGERGFSTADTPISDPWARAQSSFLGNLASQQAGAEIQAGQQEFNNMANLLNLQGNLQANADRNRQFLLGANPGAAAGSNTLTNNLLLGSANKTTNVAGNKSNIGTSPTGADIGAIGNFLTGPAAGGIVSGVGNLFRPVYNWWNGYNSGGGVGNQQYGPIAPDVMGSDYSDYGGDI